MLIAPKYDPLALHAVPTLDQVLTAGDTSVNGNIYLTNGDITLANGTLTSYHVATGVDLIFDQGTYVLKLIASTVVGSTKTITFPDATGTVALTSNLSSYLPLAGGTLTGNLLFTDATYDIGASGATRPRDLFLSRNALIGGTLGAGAITGTSFVSNGTVTSCFSGFYSSDTSYFYPVFRLNKSRGTITSPTNCLAGDYIGAYNSYVMVNGTYQGGSGLITILSSVSGTNNPITRFDFNVNSGIDNGANHTCFSCSPTLTTFNDNVIIGGAAATSAKTLTIMGLTNDASAAKLYLLETTANGAYMHYDGSANIFYLGTINTTEYPALSIARGSTTVNLLGAATVASTLGVTGLITATGGLTSSGDIKLGTVGKGYYIKEGTNATSGSVSLVAGTVTVNNTKVTANSNIYLTTQSLGTILRPVGVGVTARIAGTSFTITSMDITDTSTVSYLIIEPL